jgi:hypothetical protein
VDLPEVTALLESHERRELSWVSLKTEDLRELVNGYRKPEAGGAAAWAQHFPSEVAA